MNQDLVFADESLRRHLLDTDDNETKRIVLIVHGWMLWFVWGILGFILIASNRYLKQHWKMNMWVHLICGTFSFIINLIFGLGALYYLHWKI